MNEKKVTKKESYAMLIELAQKGEREDLVKFCQEQIDMIDIKAEKAKAKNAEKKLAEDELKNKVKAVLTKDAETINTIVEKIDVEDISRAKVIARLTALCKEGVAVKSEVVVDGKKVKAYNLAD